jgi:hypothetical protein
MDSGDYNIGSIDLFAELRAKRFVRVRVDGTIYETTGITHLVSAL